MSRGNRTNFLNICERFFHSGGGFTHGERDYAVVPHEYLEEMAELDDGLPLSEITLPGTHNSGTQNTQFAFFAKCQGLGISGQLEAGYRYLDIRLGLDEESGKLILKHDFTNCKPTALSNKALTLSEVLRDCYAFLEAHPTEAVLFCVKHEYGDFSIRDMQTLLYDEIAQNTGCWLLTDRMPTLGEARGKLVLLRRYGDDAGLGGDAGIAFAWKDQGSTAPPIEDIEANFTDDLVLWVQDRYKYETEDKWEAFCEGLEIGVGEDEAAVHFLSTAGSRSLGHPYYFALRLNRRLLAYDLPKDAPLGWIIVDFGSAKLAEKIYRCNFE